MLAERRELKTQVRWLPQIEKIRLYAAPLANTRPIDEQLIDLLAARAFYAQRRTCRATPTTFEAQRLFGAEADPASGAGT